MYQNIQYTSVASLKELIGKLKEEGMLQKGCICLTQSKLHDENEWQRFLTSIGKHQESVILTTYGRWEHGLPVSSRKHFQCISGMFPSVLIKELVNLWINRFEGTDETECSDRSSTTSTSFNSKRSSGYQDDGLSLGMLKDLKVLVAEDNVVCFTDPLFGLDLLTVPISYTVVCCASHSVTRSIKKSY